MALRIKELLYEDQYTIAGAKKRLTNELRGGGKLKVVGADDGHPSPEAASSEFSSSAPPLEGEGFVPPPNYTRSVAPRTAEERQGLKQLASELRELLALLEQENKGRAK